jgi:hypothetical protein
MKTNKKALRVDLGKYKKPNPYKKDIITDPQGQWKYPGQKTRIPSNQITMQGVPYPVLGVDDTGYSQMMYPNQEYSFPGNYVDETPMAKVGGIPELPLTKGRHAYKAWGYTMNDIIAENKKKKGGEKKYSRDMAATNKILQESALFKKKKSKKKKIFDPTSKYFQDGGFTNYIEADLTPEEIEEYRKGGYVVEDISIPTLAKAQYGPPPKGLIPPKTAAQVQKEELAKGKGPTAQGAQKINQAAAERALYEKQEAARKRAEEAKRLKQESSRVSPASTTSVATDIRGIENMPELLAAKKADDAYRQQALDRGYIAEAYGENLYNQIPTTQEYFEGYRSDPEGEYTQEDIARTENRDTLEGNVEEAKYNIWRRNEEREYQNTPWYGKALNEAQSFIADPYLHTERALQGKRSLLGQGQVSIAPEDYQNTEYYNKAFGDRGLSNTMASELLKVFNPMYYGAAAGMDARKGDYLSAAANVGQGLLSGSYLSKSNKLKKMFDTQMFLETLQEAPETIGAWSDPEANQYVNAVNTALALGYGRAGLKSLKPRAKQIASELRGIGAYKKGGLTNYQTGGKIYEYAGRPGAVYTKDNSGNWMIKTKGTNNEFVPIQDPKGERTKILNAQAKVVAPGTIEQQNLKKVKENAKKVELNRIANLKNELKVLQNEIKNSPQSELSKFEIPVAESTNSGKVSSTQFAKESYNQKVQRVKDIEKFLNQRAQNIVNYKKAQQDSEIAKKDPTSLQAIQARQRWEAKSAGVAQPSDWMWTLPIAGTSAGRAALAALASAGNAVLDAPLISSAPKITLGNIGRVYTVASSAQAAPDVYRDIKSAKTLDEKVDAGVKAFTTGIGLSPLVKWSNPIYNYVGTPLTFAQNTKNLITKPNEYNPATGLANVFRTAKLVTGRKEGGAHETELTPKQIQWYRSQGYIVEELD